jgi:hypothetical protein
MQLEKRYYTALVVYAVLGALIWFTLGDETIHISGREIKMKVLPAIVVAGFALKTVLHWHAERLRAQGEAKKG